MPYRTAGGVRRAVRVRLRRGDRAIHRGEVRRPSDAAVSCFTRVVRLAGSSTCSKPRSCAAASGAAWPTPPRRRVRANRMSEGRHSVTSAVLALVSRMNCSRESYVGKQVAVLCAAAAVVVIQPSCAARSKGQQFIKGVSRDIAKLKTGYPQLSDFSPAKHTEGEKQLVSYGYRTHRANVRAVGHPGCRTPIPMECGFTLTCMIPSPPIKSIRNQRSLRFVLDRTRCRF